MTGSSDADRHARGGPGVGRAARHAGGGGGVEALVPDIRSHKQPLADPRMPARHSTSSRREVFCCRCRPDDDDAVTDDDEYILDGEFVDPHDY